MNFKLQSNVRTSESKVRDLIYTVTRQTYLGDHRYDRKLDTISIHATVNP